MNESIIENEVGITMHVRWMAKSSLKNSLMEGLKKYNSSGASEAACESEAIFYYQKRQLLCACPSIEFVEQSEMDKRQKQRQTINNKNKVDNNSNENTIQTEKKQDNTNENESKKENDKNDDMTETTIRVLFVLLAGFVLNEKKKQKKTTQKRKNIEY